MSRADELLEQASAGKIDRRRFLYLTGAVAGTAAFSQLHADFTGAAPGLNDYPLKLGVASGDPLPDEVVLWTRLAPSPFDADGGMPSQKVPVRWRVATDESMRRVVHQGKTLAVPELAHSVHVEVDDFRPRREYFYRRVPQHACPRPVPHGDDDARALPAPARALQER
jgi:alkaline phosphatase D